MQGCLSIQAVVRPIGSLSAYAKSTLPSASTHTFATFFIDHFDCSSTFIREMKSLKFKNRNKTTKLSIVQTKTFYGGTLRYRKLLRTIEDKKALHLILSCGLNRQGFSLRTYVSLINAYILKFSSLFQVKIYKLSVNSNHIHILLKVRDRDAFKRFIRSVSASIAVSIKAQYDYEGPFWQDRPFTRVVTWGREYSGIKEYILLNFKEAVGFVAYKPRENRYKFLQQFDGIG